MAKTKETPKPKAKKTVSQKPKTIAKKAVVSPKMTGKSKPVKPVSTKTKTMKPAKSKFEPFCVFCGAPPEAVPRLIVSEYNFAICPECVEMCNTVLLSEDFDTKMKEKDKINWRKTLTELLAKPKEFFVFPDGKLEIK